MPRKDFPFCPGRAVCGVLPPHILIAICENGTAEERGWALATLVLSERLRARRELLSSLPFGTPAGEKRRTVYDARHRELLPGKLVRAEGGPPSADVEVNEAYDGAGATYDLYEEVYGRSSIDGRGMRLDSSVHYGFGYDNAFWNGSQMVYGDGDGRLFERFTKSVDVIGHELTHGVTAHEANLDYHDQPGALNESFSDVFGSLVKQRVLNQKAQEADWLIGEGLFTPRVHGSALRSMKAPGTAYDDPVLGKDPQPANMKGYVSGPEDDGGVHVNSGIPNHAFYLAAVAIGGFAWEKAGKIWYVALTERLRHDSDFAAAARLTAAAAADLFGAGGKEETAVREAWRAVGVRT
jgi:Zn-dependent metalloprotease